MPKTKMILLCMGFFLLAGTAATPVQAEPDWAGISIFQGLTAEEVQKAKTIFEEVAKDPGQVIVAEGETGDEMFVLISGRVKIFKAVGPGGEEKLLVELDASKYPVFGEMALLDSDVRSATVKASKACRLLKTSRTEFFALVEREPALGARILTSMARRLAEIVRKNNQEIAKLTKELKKARQGGD